MTQILKIEHLNKSYFGTPALDDLSFELESGEILALVGTPGSGKTTLAEILGGFLRPDSGKMHLPHISPWPQIPRPKLSWRWRYSRHLRWLALPAHITLSWQTARTVWRPARPTRLGSPVRAHHAGVTYLPAALLPASSISTAEYISTGKTGQFPFINWFRLRLRSDAAMERLGTYLDPLAQVSQLNLHDRHITEILRTLVATARLVVLDEPAAGLTGLEKDELRAYLHSLQTQGRAILYLTRSLREACALGGRVGILSAGRLLGQYTPEQATETNLAMAMPALAAPKSPWAEAVSMHPNPGPTVLNTPCLQVKEWSARSASNSMCRKISFTLQRGEIIGMTGLPGAGQVTLGRSMAGLEPAQNGQAWLNGELVQGQTHGFGRLPANGWNTAGKKIAYHSNSGSTIFTEDDGTVSHENNDPYPSALFEELSFKEYFALAADSEQPNELALARLTRWRDWAMRRSETYNEETTSPLNLPLRILPAPVRLNFLLDWWLYMRPALVILEQPFQQLQPAERQEAFQWLRALADNGTAIILISNQLDELTEICQRLLIFHRGQIQAELLPAEYSSELVMFHMEGLDVGASAPPTIWQNLAQAARSVLGELSHASGLEARLTVRQGAELVTLARSAPPDMQVPPALLGKRIPLSLTSGGRLLLAGAPKLLVDRFISSRRLTRFSRTDITEIAKIVDLARQQGFCVEISERMEGWGSLALPVHAAGETGTYAALELIGPLDRLDITTERRNEWLAALHPLELRLTSLLLTTGVTARNETSI